MKIENTGLLHASDGLRELILQNPDLPLLIFADEDANNGDYSLMTCSYVHASVGEFLDCFTPIENDYCYTDRDDFESDFAEYYFEEHKDGGLSDADMDDAMETALCKYAPYWKKCIILHVGN